MADSILKTKDLVKEYGGRKVLDGVNLNIQRGDIYGFIGKNGAGKTTLMRTVLGMTFPNAGDYELFGGMEPNKARKKVGCLIEHPALYKKWSALENMKRFSILFGGDVNDCQRILEYVGLKDAMNKKAGTMSLGMRQRLGIGIAMIGNPEFLILDEPINGLDPSGIKEIRDVILRLNQEQKITFLISSHLLDELSKIATKYGIIDHGHLLEEISAQELMDQCEQRLEIHVNDSQGAKQALSSMMDVNEIKIDGNVLSIGSHLDDSGKINQCLVEHNIEVTELVKQTESLENYFMERVGY